MNPMAQRRRGGIQPGIAAAISVCLAAGPVLAAPAAVEPSASEPAASSDPLAEAKQLYDAGLAEFDTAEYLEAIKLWSRAYKILPNTPESADIKRYIINNLAVARERQFAIDGDVMHLRRALMLAKNYSENIEALYGEGPRAAEERERTEKFLARVQSKVDEAERARAAEPAKPEPVKPEPDNDGIAPQIDRGADPGERPGRKAIIAGSVLLGAGGATGVLLIAGVAMGAAADDFDRSISMTEREKEFDRGRAGNALAIAGAVLTPVLLAAGIALVVVGSKRKRAARVAIAPTGAGILLRGRF